MKMHKLPQEILVYQCDECNGESVFAVARNVDEIPEDVHGQKVGIYVMNRADTFKVRRELK